MVWKVRLDVTVLNHEGNVAECASVAGLAALAHFKRPDVTLKGDEVKVMSFVLYLRIVIMVSFAGPPSV